MHLGCCVHGESMKDSYEGFPCMTSASNAMRGKIIQKFQLIVQKCTGNNEEMGITKPRHLVNVRYTGPPAYSDNVGTRQKSHCNRVSLYR